jgi:hypothetical protein
VLEAPGKVIDLHKVEAAALADTLDGLAAATVLGISEATVNTHLQHVYSRGPAPGARPSRQARRRLHELAPEITPGAISARTVRATLSRIHHSWFVALALGFLLIIRPSAILI